MTSHVVEVPNWQTSMIICFQQLLQSGDLCDVTLEGNDGLDIRCHAVVLAAASSYFRNTLVWTREDFRIKIGSISSNTWKSVVEFIYCGRIVFDSQNAMEIMMITKKLGLVALLAAIEEYFRKFGITEEHIAREPRAIERDTIQSANDMLVTSPTGAAPQTTPATAAADEVFRAEPAPDRPEGFPVIGPVVSVATEEALVTPAPPPAGGVDNGQVAVAVALPAASNTGAFVVDGVAAGGQPDQNAFFEGLGLQAHKSEPDKPPADAGPQVRHSKRIVNSGRKLNFREMEGRKQSNQSPASQSPQAVIKPKDLISCYADDGDLIDEGVANFDENFDGKRVLFTCKFCYRVFPNRSLLCKHKAKWHAKTTKNTGKKAHKTFWCKLCNISFRAPSALYKHKKDFHPEIVGQRLSAEDLGEVELKDIKESVGLEQSEQHAITELSEVMPKQFTCKVCDEIYPDRHSLYQHKMEEHYVKKSACRPKGMKYTPVARAAAAAAAVKKTAPPKTRGAFFKCKKCLKAFNNPGSLRWHKCPAAATHPLPEGVTPIPVPPPPTAADCNTPQKDPTAANGEHPIAGDERITPIKPKTELTDKDAEDIPLDLSTRNPGGMSYRCDECLKIFSSLVLVRWHRLRCSARAPSEERGLVKDKLAAVDGQTCHVCHKVFKTQGYLQWHLNRRHGMRLSDSSPLKPRVVPAAVGAGGGITSGGGTSGGGGKTGGGVKTGVRLECKICMKTYSNKHFLKEHIEAVHEGSADHRCKVCLKSFSRRYYLAHHVRKVHEGFKPLRCAVCNKAFITKTRLVRHMQQFHGVSVSVDEIALKEEAQPAADAPVQFAVAARSVAQSTVAQSAAAGQLPKTPPRAGTNGAQGVYRCERCPRQFSMPHHLARHVKATHMPGVIFSCERCSQQFNKEKLLVAHMDREHADVEDEDSDEDIKPSAMPGLMRHGGGGYRRNPPVQAQAPVAVGAGNYICGICRGGFVTETALREHVRSAHELATPPPVEQQLQQGDGDLDGGGGSPSRGSVPCPHCSKRLSSRAILSQHIRTVHDGLKNYECTICNKRFAQKHHLTRHVFLHGGVRPFACEFCHKRFITNYSLVTHTKTTHRDLVAQL